MFAWGSPTDVCVGPGSSIWIYYFILIGTEIHPQAVYGAYTEATSTLRKEGFIVIHLPDGALFPTWHRGSWMLRAAFLKGTKKICHSKNHLVFVTCELGFKLRLERSSGSRRRKGWRFVLRNGTLSKRSMPSH